MLNIKKDSFSFLIISFSLKTILVPDRQKEPKRDQKSVENAKFYSVKLCNNI